MKNSLYARPTQTSLLLHHSSVSSHGQNFYRTRTYKSDKTGLQTASQDLHEIFHLTWHDIAFFAC